MTNRKRCCCNCRRNKRVKDRTGYIRCYCELDNHYIGYLEAFGNWCPKWEKEKRWGDGSNYN